MPRKPLIAANWKMYKTPVQAQEFMKNFLPLVANHDRDEIVVCPSFTSISVVIAAATGSGVAIGAQNMHFADEGAYTGETSPLMLKAIGATHVILGHSERRQYFGETDEFINKKLKSALHHGLVPIVCVGEVLAEREAGKTEEVLLRQTAGCPRWHHRRAQLPPSSSPTSRSGPSVPAKPPPRRWPPKPTPSSAKKSRSSWDRKPPTISASSMEAASNLTTPPP